jgi:hypothetical protein
MDKIGLAYRLDAIAGMWPILGKDARAAIRQAAAALRESEELSRDAERYRYIRRPDAWKEQYISVRGGISAVYVSDGRTGHATHGDALDAAIDSARGAIDAARKEGV